MQIWYNQYFNYTDEFSFANTHICNEIVVTDPLESSRWTQGPRLTFQNVAVDFTVEMIAPQQQRLNEQWNNKIVLQSWIKNISSLP